LREAGYDVQREECRITGAAALSSDVHYCVKSGKVISASVPVAPAAAADRLYLVHVSGLPEFRPLYEALSSMGFYNLNPDRIRDLQPPDTGDLLARDGRNLASVLGQLGEHSSPTKSRIEEYLAKIVVGVQRVGAKSIGPKETIEFDQLVAGSGRPWSFLAANMSDGTLRALGVLVALFQSTNGHARPVPLVAIEEPEVALHPAAAGVLLDALNEASLNTQVLVTSHSPDLLDDPRISSTSVLAVVAEKGLTRIGPLDEVGASALRDHLFTPGELLRMNQLSPDPESVKSQSSQMKLFGASVT
jgi:predicted ATPase